MSGDLLWYYDKAVQLGTVSDNNEQGKSILSNPISGW